MIKQYPVAPAELNLKMKVTNADNKIALGMVNIFTLILGNTI